MDAERLAAIRADAAELCGTMFPSSEVRDLCDHIDALQAENERLRREAINARRARVASLREQNQGLQARVTLLEGLLGETIYLGSWTWAQHNEWEERRDAALSRSDTSKDAL